MKYDYLGRTGLKVSKLVLGTMNFGWRTSEEEAFKIMDRALELGINMFDEADSYGMFGEPPVYYAGKSEEIVGRWFAQGGNRRERTILATKSYMKLNDPLDGINDDAGLSAYKLRRHLDRSLKRMQTDHVEIYYMHHHDPHMPWEEVFEAYNSFITSGKTYYMGSSNFGARHLAGQREMANKRNMLGSVVEQCQYNLLNRLPEVELLPAAQELGIGVLVWSPLAEGRLSGKVLGSREGSRTIDCFNGMDEKQLAQIRKFSELCAEIGESEANVALAWILRNPAVTGVIIGPRTLEQLEDTMHCLDIELSEDTLTKLDEIFPGYKAAPLAYGW